MNGYDIARENFNSKAKDSGIYKRIQTTGQCIKNFDKRFEKIKEYCDLCSARGCGKCIKANLEKEY